VRTQATGFDLEAHLKARTPLAARAADRTIPVMLMGGMGSFQWGIVGDHPLTARRGERVHIVMQNHSTMADQMNLPGHHFPGDRHQRQAGLARVRDDCVRRRPSRQVGLPLSSPLPAGMIVMLTYDGIA
jgi:hypothetical protein